MTLSPQISTPSSNHHHQHHPHHGTSPSPQKSPGGNRDSIIEMNGQEFFWVEYQPSREPTVLVEPTPETLSTVPTIRRRLTNLLIPPLDIREELIVVHPENEPEDVVEELSVKIKNISFFFFMVNVVVVVVVVALL